MLAATIQYVIVKLIVINLLGNYSAINFCAGFMLDSFHFISILCYKQKKCDICWLTPKFYISHFQCINISSTKGGNFCKVTQQPNWCSDKMTCVGEESKKCPVRHWCVCQWAFAGYIEEAGGCDKIQDIVCDAVNINALKAYEKKKMKAAYECIKSRCSLESDS